MAWDLVKPQWETSSIPDDFRKRWIAQFGDNSKAERLHPGQPVGPNNPLMYPGANGGVRMTKTLPYDRYNRRAVVEGSTQNPADAAPIPIPYVDQIKEADNTQVDPYKGYRDSSNWNADTSINGALKRAQAIASYKLGTPASQTDNDLYDSLRNRREILDSMRTHLGALSNTDLSKGTLMGADVLSLFGVNMDKPFEDGQAAVDAIQKKLEMNAAKVNPNLIAFYNDLARARQSGLFLPGTEASKSAAPLAEVIGSTPEAIKTLVGLNFAQKGLDWLANEPNVSLLRKTLPQDIVTTDRALYGSFKNNPNVIHSQQQYDYVNAIAANEEGDYGDSSYRAKEIPTPDESSSTLVNPQALRPPPPAAPATNQPAPAQPTGQPARPQAPATGTAPVVPPAPVSRAQPATTATTGTTTTATPATPAQGQGQVPPAVAANTPLGQRILQTLGHFFTFSLGKHGQPQPTTQPQPTGYVGPPGPQGEPAGTPTRPTPPQAPVRRAQPVTTTRAHPAASGQDQTPSVPGLPRGFDTRYGGWGTPEISGMTKGLAQKPTNQPLTPGFLPGAFPVIPRNVGPNWSEPEDRTRPRDLPPNPAQNIRPPPDVTPDPSLGGGTSTMYVPQSTDQPQVVYAQSGGLVRPQIVQATHQDHVDALESGTPFTWPDGNTYVKT